MRFEARVLVEAQHRVLGLQIGLGRDAVSGIGELGRQQAAQRPRAAGAFVLNDQELTVGGVHRRGDVVEIITGEEGGQKDEKRQPDHEKAQFAAAAAADVALDFRDFAGASFGRAQFGGGKIAPSGGDGLGQLNPRDIG